MAISENGVSFFGSGGHSHNGINSTIIDVGSYSLFDFSLGYTGSQTRINRQSVNQSAMEEWVIRIVNSKVLTPAGLSLAPDTLSGKSIRANTITATQIQANTITADEISANTITSNELSSNIVLINNIIRSNNYDGTIAANGVITGQGTAGWAITYAGSAEFSSASIRGAITANSVSTPGIDILSNGAIVSTNFSVTPEGNVSATNASLTGSVTATSGSIGGWNINTSNISAGSTTLYSNGTIIIGDDLSVGNNVRVNGATGDGGATTFKVRGSSTAGSGWSFRAQNSANTHYFGVRNDGEIYMANIGTDSGTVLVLNSSGYVQKQSSTIQIKENIEYINESVFDLIKELKPVKFTYKRNKNDDDYTYALKQINKEVGFILEDIIDVQKNFEGSLVSYEFDSPEYRESIDGRLPFSVEEDFQHLRPVMYKDLALLSLTIKAVQELIAKVEDLEARLQALEDV
jgi:hypothetical protein